jgi:hypothetical protein
MPLDLAPPDATHEKMLWAHPGVGSWYMNRRGQMVTNLPLRLMDDRAMTETLNRNVLVMG